MAKLNKSNKEAEVQVTPEVEVAEAKTEEVVTENTEEVTETEAGVENAETVQTPEVEVADEEPEVKEDDVVVEAKTEAKKPNGKVKIRMRVDHKCCIAMERYDLKAGKTYEVPRNVKNILNKAGLLAPLN